MITSLGLIELNSIARGYEVADAMLKAADVKLIKAHSICPGKFIAMICGDVGAVKAAVSSGIEIGRGAVVDDLVIANIHKDVIPSISGTSAYEMGDSLGVLEFFSVATAIVAADACAKAAEIKLIEIRLGFAIGGKAFVTLTGDVSAVNAAIEAGAEVAKESGLLVDKTVIPRPHKDLKDVII